MEQFAQYRQVCDGAARFYIEIGRIYNISVAVFTKLFLISIEGEEVLKYTFKISFKDFFLFIQFQTLNDQDTKGKLARLTFARIARSIPKVQHTKLGLFICKFVFPHQISEKV